MNFKDLLILVLCIGCINTFYNLNAQNNLFSSDCFKHATYCLTVLDLDNEQTIIGINQEKSLIPASTLKVVSTATSLLHYGLDYKINTPLFYHGNIKDSVLYGDIIIKANGDPTLGSNKFPDSEIASDWAQAISKLGIRKIDGKIIADLSSWSKNYAPMEWLWGDLGNYYGAAFCALTYKENTYFLSMTSKSAGSRVQIKDIQPNIPQLTFDCRVIAANNNRDNAYILGSPLSMQRQVVGTIPANRESFTIKGSIPNPSQILLIDLQNQLSTLNITSNGMDTSWLPYAQNLDLICNHYSPTLIEIVHTTNKLSHNLFAESIAQLYIKNAMQDPINKFSPYPILQYWKKRGINTNGVLMYDGCGLSPRNLVTGEFMTELLSELYHSSIYNQFLETLPVSGKDGTLSNFLKGSHLEGRVIAKSGSLKGVLCYAGYIKHKEKTYAFSLMVNNYTAPYKTVFHEIEQILLQVDKQL